MNGAELVKYTFPIIIFTFWIYTSHKEKSKKISLGCLFFSSIVACSQNFEFIYRQIHQLIQILLCVCFLTNLASKGSLPKASYILIIFLGFVVASLIATPFDQDAKAQLINIIICAIISCFLLQIVDSTLTFSIFLRYIGSLASISATSGLMEFFIDQQLRIESTFANPNYYALFLGIGWCSVFSLGKGLSKWIQLSLITSALILTGSRAGLLLPIFQILWILYVQRNFLKTFLYTILSLAIILFILASGLTRFSATEDTAGSDSERLIFAKIAINMAGDHPLTGVGWGRFVTEFANYSSSVDKIELENGVIDASLQERRVTHNDFLRILAELGWPAMITSFFFIFISGSYLLKYKAYDIAALFPVWAGLVVFSLLHNNLNTALTWFFLLIPFHLRIKAMRDFYRTR